MTDEEQAELDRLTDRMFSKGPIIRVNPQCRQIEKAADLKHYQDIATTGNEYGTAYASACAEAFREGIGPDPADPWAPLPAPHRSDR